MQKNRQLPLVVLLASLAGIGLLLITSTKNEENSFEGNTTKELIDKVIAQRSGTNDWISPSSPPPTKVGIASRWHHFEDQILSQGKRDAQDAALII